MNWVRAGRAVLLGMLAVSSTACETTNSSPTAPAAPSGPSVFAPQFVGLWAGTAVLTKVTPVIDGECVHPSLEGQIGTPEGSDKFMMTVTDDGKSLAGRFSSASTGLSCSYKGTATPNTLALNADAPLCDAPMLLLRCGPDGPVRELKPLGSTLQGTMSGGKIDGTMAHSYNAFESDGGKGVTRVILNYQFTAVKP